MTVGWSEVVISIAVLLAAIYYYLTCNYDFWKSRGVPGPKPELIFGTIRDLVEFKYSLGSYLKKIYDEYCNEPMIGIYTRRQPVLVLNDLDLIKSVLIKDFDCFSDRGMEIHERAEPLSSHLFNLEPKRWRLMRPKLSPAYTSGKLRQMFYLLRECTDQLDGYLEEFEGKAIDIREIGAKFMTDVIGLCAFGVQANALKNDDSIFRRMGKRIFQSDWKAIWKFRLRAFAPPLYHLIGHWFADQGLSDFFINLTRDTMKYRKERHVFRNDFLDQLMELKNTSSKVGDIELNDSFLASQLFVFFIAGFETSSSTMSNCLFELALNHNIRDRLRSEICEELAKTNGEITYEGIKGMKYLDRTIKETLRKYPPVTVLMRKSVFPYTFPGTNVSIPANMRVWIPIYAIQRDERYFSDPEVFDPDRFTEEAVQSRHQMTLLSFGNGPRNCIGARFGSMQTKVALVKILEKFTVDVCEKTDKEYTIDTKNFLLTPKNGVYVKLMKA